MKWKLMSLIAIAAFAFGTTADAQSKKSKKPVVKVEDTHTDRDHQIEADDVEVEREKTTYGGASANKRFNLRFNPIALLFGIANVDLDIKIAPKFTIGPMVSYISTTYNSTSATAYAIGGRLNYYPMVEALSEDGFYLAPYAQFIKAEAKNSFGSASVSGMQYALIAGYQWMWDSFNINLGAGPQVLTLPKRVTYKNNATGATEEKDFAYRSSGVAIEFTLGFAF